MAESVAQLSELNRLVRGAGFAVVASVELKSTNLNHLPAADLWVVNLDMHSPSAQAVVDQLDTLAIPVIYDDDLQASAESPGQPVMPAELRARRERRLGVKIRQLVREPAEVNTPRAHKVWVLAASTGGPDAVVEFLNGIPEDIGDIAFLYAQHTEQHALANLRAVVAKRSKWGVLLVDSTRVIREKCVYVLAPNEQVELLEGGLLSPCGEAWSGRFHPCINQVIARVARIYGARGGAIVFSGMGDDGAHSSTLLHHRGGQVWVQSPATCAADSMPVSVLATGCVQFQGSPTELAQQFVRLHRYNMPPPKQSAGA